MGRLINAKCRLCRREGEKLFLKGARCFTPKCPIEKKGAVPPGLHGVKSRRKPSDYGIQLRGKQKAKRIYEIMEKQFKKYFTMAAKYPGATGEILLQLLERRLDNVVYRLGLAPDRTTARQIVSHGHAILNGRKNNIPSTLVKINDLISIDNKAQNIDIVKKLIEDKTFKTPSWLERKAVVGKVIALPKKEDIDSNINEQLIVEFYSR